MSEVPLYRDGPPRSVCSNRWWSWIPSSLNFEPYRVTSLIRNRPPP